LLHTIAVIGADNELCAALQTALERHGGVARVTETDVAAWDAELSEQFLLLECIHPRRFDLRDGVYLLADTPEHLSGWELPASGCAVVDSAEHWALPLLKGSGTPAISCGLHGSDTLCLSSFAEGECSVSLQRPLAVPGGAEVEPCEIPIHLTMPVRERGVAVICAALLLCGISPENGYTV